MSPLDTTKLANICARFASDADNERSTAARLADEMIKRSGLNWHQVFNVINQQSHATPDKSRNQLRAELAMISASVFLMIVMVIAVCAAIVTFFGTIASIAVLDWPDFQQYGLTFLSSIVLAIVSFIAAKWLKSKCED